MEEIRGKTLKEWKDYCKSDNVPIKTMKYIACLEERIEALTIPVVSNSVICCPQCGNERLESTGDGWYICCDKDCDWGDKL